MREKILKPLLDSNLQNFEENSESKPKPIYYLSIVERRGQENQIVQLLCPMPHTPYKIGQVIQSQDDRPPSEIRLANLQFYPHLRTIVIDGVKTTLSASLRDILSLLVMRKDDFTTRDELHRLLSHGDNPDRKTIDFQMNRLRLKLRGFKGEIRTYYKRGYRLVYSESAEPSQTSKTSYSEAETDK